MFKTEKYRSSREGKTALRNYIRDAMKRYRASWTSPRGKWSNATVGEIDESILVDRIGVRIVKWDPYFHACVVCVYDKEKPVTMRRWDGQEYEVIKTWNNCEFYKVYEMINKMTARILKLPH